MKRAEEFTCDHSKTRMDPHDYLWDCSTSFFHPDCTVGIRITLIPVA